MKEYRFALEMIESGFELPINPSDVYDHASVYIYRILHGRPVTINITFMATGLSYVEVYDADNTRFLLPEKTEITPSPVNEASTFTINWDGYGVFEPRVWAGSNVFGIKIEFYVPDNERVQRSFGVYDPSFIVGWGGFSILFGGLIK